MLVQSQYQMKKLGGMLKRGEAYIPTKVSLGNRWPDYPHAWVIDVFETQQTFHVYVNDRPSWKKYQYDLFTNA